MILLFLLTVFFFARQLFLRESFYCCDNLLLGIPAHVYFAREIVHGQFPLWNPYMFSGTPFFADIGFGLLYPLNILYFLLPAFQALTAGIILSFTIAVAGMYILGRAYFLSKEGAAISAVVFGFSGTLVTYTNNISILQVASLIPWVIWSLVRFLEKPTTVTFCLAIVIAALQVLAGHPQLTYYTWLFIIPYVMFVYKARSRKKIILLSGFGIGTLILSAVQTLPFVEFAGLSNRVGRGFDYAAFDSLHPLNLVRMILPNLVGDQSAGTAWVQAGSVYGYVGTLAILLALFAPFRKKLPKYLGIITLGALLLAFGKYTPLYLVVYKILPGISAFRSPQHFLFLYTFCIALLAGFGFDNLEQNKRLSERFIRVLLYIGGFAIALAIILFILSAQKIPVSYLSLLPIKLITKLQNFPAFGKILELSSLNAFLSAGIIFIAAYSFKKYKQAIVLLCFIELWLFASHGILTVPYNKINQWFERGSQMAGELHPAGKASIFVSRTLDAAPREKRFGLANFDEESAWQVATLRTNLPMLYGLSSPDGYASMVYRPYALSLSNKTSDPTGIDSSAISDTSWASLGVGSLAIRDPKATGNVTVSRLPTNGRIFLQSNGQTGSEGIITYEMNSNFIHAEVSLSKPTLINFINVNYPGWNASIDGKRVPIIPYRNVFQQISVPAGTHSISLRYLPGSVILGAFISLFGIIAITMLLISGALNRRKS